MSRAGDVKALAGRQTLDQGGPGPLGRGGTLGQFPDLQQPATELQLHLAVERELERSLLDHIRKFLIELGAGFAFVGQQVHLEIEAEMKSAPAPGKG
jgi:hypothetical protein